MNTSFWKMMTLVLLTVLSITSCNKNAKNATSPTSDYLLRPSEIRADGCLNMELLLNKMSNFPDGTQGQKLTTDIQIQGSDNSKPQFLNLLNRATFILQEKEVKELQDFASAKQNGCHSVTLFNDQGQGQSYNITGSTVSSLAMEDLPDGRTLTVSVTNPTSVKFTFSYGAIDVCDNGTPAQVMTTQVLTWGDSLNGKVHATVSTEMLKNLIPSTDNPPVKIQEIVSEATSPRVSVAISDLKSLLDSPVRTDILGCWPPAPAAIPPPALPSASPDNGQPGATVSPTPTPTRVERHRHLFL